MNSPRNHKKSGCRITQPRPWLSNQTCTTSSTLCKNFRISGRADAKRRAGAREKVYSNSICALQTNDVLVLNFAVAVAIATETFSLSPLTLSFYSHSLWKYTQLLFTQSRNVSGHGCQMATARLKGHMCLALRASGLWLRYAALQNLIPSFPWIAPPRSPSWCNPRKGRDHILPSGNLPPPFPSFLPRNNGTDVTLGDGRTRKGEKRYKLCQPSEVFKGLGSIQYSAIRLSVTKDIVKYPTYNII